MTECLNHCDHCAPDAWHSCERPEGHDGYHSCEMQPEDF